jgi:hypothetical protein
MSPILWLLIGLPHLWWSVKFSGQHGSERFKRLPEQRAQTLHELFISRVHDFLLVSAVATCVLGLVFALVLASLWTSVLWGADVIVLVLALGLRRRARPVVVHAFSARQLPPLQAREFSAKRNRRQKQFGVVALCGFLVGETARFFGERQGNAALEALASVALLVAFLGVGALLWSTAWLYGDEARSNT